MAISANLEQISENVDGDTSGKSFGLRKLASESTATWDRQSNHGCNQYQIPISSQLSQSSSSCFLQGIEKIIVYMIVSLCVSVKNDSANSVSPSSFH